MNAQLSWVLTQCHLLLDCWQQDILGDISHRQGTSDLSPMVPVGPRTELSASWPDCAAFRRFIFLTDRLLTFLNLTLMKDDSCFLSGARGRPPGYLTMRYVQESWSPPVVSAGPITEHQPSPQLMIREPRTLSIIKDAVASNTTRYSKWRKT
jgi:hypothetical protein